MLLLILVTLSTYGAARSSHQHYYIQLSLTTLLELGDVDSGHEVPGHDVLLGTLSGAVLG